MARPADPFRVFMRQQFAEWSDRTFARYWRAFSILRELCTREQVEDAIRQSTRPNGSLNVSKFERIADGAVVAYIRADGLTPTGS